MKKTLMVVASLVGVAGCGGGPPLSFWLITADQTPPPVCVPAPTKLPTDTDTKSNIVSASTWELYPGAKDSSGKDTFILEPGTGQTAFVGSKDGDKYTFTGVDTRVTKMPTAEAPTATFTVTDTTTITFTINGSTLTGTATDVTANSCAGTACPMGTPQPCDTSSTSTTTFSGTQVTAEIKHDV